MERFIKAHKQFFNQALREIKEGEKRTHWMWFIFPQLEILGYSETAKYYGIKNKEEALLFLENEYLSNNLLEITKAVLSNNGNIEYIMGDIDALKLKSSMTLFYMVSKKEIFKAVLDKFYNGEFDKKTINFLNGNN